ncbi:MAG TPA: hypothetical protein VFG30_18895 [Polyangiales bacterium]|nr:hypothetical protein [Polyangiales bacterium]
MNDTEYPAVEDPSQVGSYDVLTNTGGGYVWDAVLEYRVWCHPARGAEDLHGGDDYFYPFEKYHDALAFSLATEGAEPPLALIRQDEYIDEPEIGQYVHVREVRITEWPVEFLQQPRRTRNTIPDFLSECLEKLRSEMN